MKPDALIHFADRVADIGACEGPWWRLVGDFNNGSPDGLAVRLDDGVRAYVVGHCKTRATYTRVRGRWEHGLPGSYFDRYQLWTDMGYPTILAIHEHRTDALLWRDVRELEPLGRHAMMDGVDHVFFDRADFTMAACGLARA